MKITLCILLCLIFFEVQARPADQFQKKVYQSEAGNLNYRIFIPKLKKNKNLPLILTLHSGRSFGTDNEKHITTFRTAEAWAEPEAQRNNRSFILSPQISSAKNLAVEKQLILEMLDSVVKEYSVDTSRIYITGTSAGAFWTWEFLSLRPNFFAAAIPMSAGAGRRWQADWAPKIKDTPIWAIHSHQDSIVPVATTRKAVAELEKQGISFAYTYCTLNNCDNKTPDKEITKLVKSGTQHIYTEVPGSNHFIWDQFYDDKTIHSWLFSKKLTAIN